MTITVDGLPPLSWSNGPGEAEVTAERLSVIATAGTDWTNDALGGPHQHAATSLSFFLSGDFSLSARVRVTGQRTTFDAAVLAIWGDGDHWTKLCFEFSPQGHAMVVSVVTNDVSDDCNSAVVPDDRVYLRITRAGPGRAFHSSRDGIQWDFVRVFRLAFAGPLSVGFMAQAPMGDSCIAVFDEIRLRPGTLSNMRDGS